MSLANEIIYSTALMQRQHSPQAILMIQSSEYERGAAAVNTVHKPPNPIYPAIRGIYRYEVH